MAYKQDYDVLGNVDKDIFKVYPRLTFLSDGVNLTEVKVSVDSLVRYTVFFHTRSCPVHKEIPNVEKRREHCLKLFNIDEKMWDKPKFIIVELDMAEKFLLLNGDTKYQLYISTLFKFSEMCRNLMDRTVKFKWEDGKSAIQVAAELKEMEERISALHIELFGDIDALHQHMLDKSMRDNHSAERMAE